MAMSAFVQYLLGKAFRIITLEEGSQTRQNARWTAAGTTRRAVLRPRLRSGEAYARGMLPAMRRLPP